LKKKEQGVAHPTFNEVCGPEFKIKYKRWVEA